MQIGDGKNVLTRLHRANIIADVFGGAKPIHQALARSALISYHAASFACVYYEEEPGRPRRRAPG